MYLAKRNKSKKNILLLQGYIGIQIRMKRHYNSSKNACLARKVGVGK